MKKNLFLLLFIFPILVSAQVQWQNGGVSVRLGDNINYDIFTTTQDNNTFVNVWSDTRNGIRGIFAQKVDSSGNKLWNENDVEIFNPNRRQIISNTISTTDNCTVICWTDYLQEDDSLDQCRIQKIDSDGNKLWGAVGLVLASSEAYYDNCQLVPHSDGGLYIFWRNNIEQSIEGARILADGSLAEGWSPGYNILSTSGIYSVASDLEDGVVLSSIYTDQAYVQRVDENSSLLWGSLGNLIQDGEVYNQIDITTAEPGTYYCSWEKSFSPDDFRLLANKLNAAGETQWADHTAVISDYSILGFESSTIESDLYLAYRGLNDLSIQKIDSSGSVSWESGGVQLVDNSYSISLLPKMVKDDENNLILNWYEAATQDDESKLVTQKVNSAGELLFGESGLISYASADGVNKTSFTASEQNYYFMINHREDLSANLKQLIFDYQGNSVVIEENTLFKTNLLGSCGYNKDVIAFQNNPAIIWTDKRDKDADRIYMQILDEDGNGLLDENGKPITPYQPNNQWDADTAVNNSQDELAISWSEIIDGYPNIYSQAYDQYGNANWSSSDALLINPTSTSHNMDSKISFYDNNGVDEYYIGWKSLNGTGQIEIKAQKIIDGILQWAENAVSISDPSYDGKLFDVEGNYFIWSDSTWPDLDLRVTLLQPDGTLAEGWPENGLIIDSEVTNEDYVKANLTPEGLLVTWSKSVGNDKVIYVQLIDSNGNKLWGNDGSVLVSDIVSLDYAVVISDYLYIAWSCFTEPFVLNYFMQKYDFAGNAHWDEDGNQFTAYDIVNHWMQRLDLAFVNNGIVATWEYFYPDEVKKIDAQYISCDSGEFLFSPALEICDEYMAQGSPHIAGIENSAYISWFDGRSTIDTYYGMMSQNGVFAQKLTIDSSSGDNTALPFDSITLMNNYPNPFNPSTNIQFSLPSDSAVELSIFNIKGQKIQTLCKDELEKGEHSFNWNGTDKNQNSVSSGIYLYKLKTDSHSITKRMVLLK